MSDFDILCRLGWDHAWIESFAHHDGAAAVPARVSRVDRGMVTVLSADGERRAVSAGLTLAVGDWVAVTGDAITALLPRRSLLRRKAAGEGAEEQLVAANIDVVGVVVALDAPLRPRKLERLVAAAWSSGAQPAVVLTKTDLAEDPAGEAALAATIARDVEVVAVCALTGEGMEGLGQLAPPGRTLGLIGPSGVGKSTLVNHLVGAALLDTAEVRGDGRGRHTTTHRELVPLPGGGLLIDTPGMRELGLWEAGEAIGRTFADLEELALQCRFSDCHHAGEPGCAIQGALTGDPNLAGRLESWKKLWREEARLETMRDQQSLAEARRALRRRARELRRLSSH